VNHDQIKSVAAGFLHALQTSPTIYDEWIAVEPGDSARYGAIVAKAMHLATTPTQAQMDAMDAYLDSSLPDQLKAFAATHTLPPRVRLMCVLKQG
jgi:hypothetical protein